jgi:plastocyanin
MVEKKRCAKARKVVPALSAAIATLLAVAGVADESFAGGGGGKSGITEECDEAICQVSMTSLTFAPDTLKIRPGATVVWTNSDNVPHTVTSSNPNYETGTLFDSGLSSPILGGEKWNHTFKSPGIANYSCAFHPLMTGQVVVTGEPIEEFPRLAVMIIAGAGVFGVFGLVAAVYRRKR